MAPGVTPAALRPLAIAVRSRVRATPFYIPCPFVFTAASHVRAADRG